jgi:hypothetical protein
LGHRVNSYGQKGQLHNMKAVTVLVIAYAEGAFDFSFVEVLSAWLYKLREKNHINAIVLNMLVNNASALVAGMVS